MSGVIGMFGVSEHDLKHILAECFFILIAQVMNLQIASATNSLTTACYLCLDVLISNFVEEHKIRSKLNVQTGAVLLGVDQKHITICLEFFDSCSLLSKSTT